MAVDVGFVSSGVAVMEWRTPDWVLTELYCLKTKPSPRRRRLRVADDDASRVQDMAGEISRIVQRASIFRMAVELPSGGAQSARAMRSMGLATGMIATIAALLSLKVEWYSPGETRKAATGSRYSRDVVGTMARKYPEMAGFKSAVDRKAVADALATFEACRAVGLLTMVK